MCDSSSGARAASLKVALHDARLAKVVRRCQELPGQELFQYQDESGARVRIGSADVNAYLREITTEDFTAKDFRTGRERSSSPAPFARSPPRRTAPARSGTSSVPSSARQTVSATRKRSAASRTWILRFSRRTLRASLSRRLPRVALGAAWPRVWRTFLPTRRAFSRSSNVTSSPRGSRARAHGDDKNDDTTVKKTDVFLDTGGPVLANTSQNTGRGMSRAGGNGQCRSSIHSNPC